MVKDTTSEMSLFVVGLGHASSKEGRAAILIGDIDIFKLMVYVPLVEEENPWNREEYRNKKYKTENESGQQKSGPSRPQFQK